MFRVSFRSAALVLVVLLVTPQSQAGMFENMGFDSNLDGWEIGIPDQIPDWTVDWSPEYGGSARIWVSGSPAQTGIWQNTLETIRPGDRLKVDVYHTAGSAKNWNIRVDGDLVARNSVSAAGNDSLTWTAAKHYDPETLFEINCVTGGGPFTTWVKEVTYIPSFTADYTTSAPTIDGICAPGEWGPGYTVTMEQHDGGADPHDCIVSLQHDDSHLYVGVLSGWGSGWNVVWDCFIDGDCNGDLNGSLAKPYTDINMCMQSPDGYSGFEAYRTLPSIDEQERVPFEDGAACASESVGNENVFYEFCIPLADLDAVEDDFVGFFLSHGYDGQSEHLYEMWGGSRYDPENWSLVKLAAEPTPGDMNGDGFVGSADLDVVRANWGSQASAGAGANVPEPSIAIIGLLGTMCLLPRRSRR